MSLRSALRFLALLLCVATPVHALKEALVSTGVQLAAAFADPLVGTARINASFRLSDADWAAFGPLPILVDRNVTIEPAGPDIPIVDLAFIKHKVR